MKARWLGIAALGCVVGAAWVVGSATPLAPAGAGEGADALRADLDFARRKVYPALVNIGVVARIYTGGRIQRAPAAGSGVVVGPDGLVLTNFHVAGDAERITCTLPTGEVLDADVVAHDPAIDISVLRIRLAERRSTAPLPFATIGDSDVLEVGDHVLAMGNPLTLSSSMTLGIVSNLKRVFTDFTGTETQELDIEGEATGMFTRWLQHDALILPGNSGGPLVNLKGEVVGINTRGGSGVAFATPSNLVAKTLHQALAYGEVRRGWLGLAVLPVSKLGRAKGALVSFVSPGSAAAAAGVQPGDILTAIDGEPVDVRFFEQAPLLYQRIAELPIGTPIALTLERSGATRTVQATATKMERAAGAHAEARGWGITVQDITGPMALARRYPDDAGVVVTGVRPGFPVEEADPRLQSGDVIRSLAGKPVADLASFRAALDAAREADEVAVAYRRDREQLVTTVKKPAERAKQRGGQLPKAWLGVRTQVCTPAVSRAMGAAGTKGYRISRVHAGTEAAKAGLQAGDVLVGFDGQALDASRPQDAQDLRRLVEDRAIGDKVKVAVLREGKRQELTVTLEASPKPAGEAATAQDKDLEFGVRELVWADRDEHDWDASRTGVVVTEATSGGFAHMAGLHGGDVIAAINDVPVTDVKGFEKVRDDLHKSRPRVVTIFVHREHRTHFVVVEPDWSALEKSK